MADIDLKAATPDTTLPTTGFLFGADSQAAASPSVYSTQTVATTLLGSTSLTGATITADAPVLNLSQTWNNAGVTFTGLRYNATDTASASGSLLMDLQVGGSSRFNVGKTGSLKLGVSPTGTNQAGTNVTIAGSQGTGTGAGGSIIFQVAPAGSSGTAQNALVDALTIDSTRKLTLVDGANNSPVIGFASNSATSGFYRLATNGFAWSLNGNQWFYVNQTAWGIFRNDVPLAFGSGSDLFIHRDAANTLALRNGTNAQELRWYRTFTDASNRQNGALKTAASEIIIEAQTAGTGADDIDVTLTPAGTGNVRFGTHTATSDTAVSGYIEIKDAGGTIRKLAVIT